jgi:hypothetical protein
MSNFTKPSSLIFSKSDWHASSFEIFARFITSKTFCGFSRNALKILSRSLVILFPLQLQTRTLLKAIRWTANRYWRQSSIAPTLNAPKNSGLHAVCAGSKKNNGTKRFAFTRATPVVPTSRLAPDLSMRKKFVRQRQRTPLVGFQGNLLGQHNVARDQMIARQEAPARSRQGRIV